MTALPSARKGTKLIGSAEMAAACAREGITLYHPSPIYCTDNAAMIGVAGYHEYKKGVQSGWELNAIPHLKLGER